MRICAIYLDAQPQAELIQKSNKIVELWFLVFKTGLWAYNVHSLQLILHEISPFLLALSLYSPFIACVLCVYAGVDVDVPALFIHWFKCVTFLRIFCLSVATR